MKFRILIFCLSLVFVNPLVQADESSADISFYTGTFDTIDKEGDDQTSLFGIN